MTLLLVGVVWLFPAHAGDRPRASEVEPGWEQADPVDVRVSLLATFVAQEEWDQALRFVAEVRAEGIEDPRLDLLQAEALINRGLAGEALALVSGREHRSSASAWRLRGLACAALDRPEEGVEAFERAIRLSGENVPAAWYNNLGYLHAATSAWADAIEAYRHALLLEPANSRARNNLGFALAASGRDDEALDAFRAAADPSTPPEAFAWYNLGVARENGGDTPGAMTAYAASLRQHPDFPPAQEALRRLGEHP